MLYRLLVIMHFHLMNSHMYWIANRTDIRLAEPGLLLPYPLPIILMIHMIANVDIGMALLFPCKSLIMAFRAKIISSSLLQSSQNTVILVIRSGMMVSPSDLTMLS